MTTIEKFIVLFGQRIERNYFKGASLPLFPEARERTGSHIENSHPRSDRRGYQLLQIGLQLQSRIRPFIELTRQPLAFRISKRLLPE